MSETILTNAHILTPTGPVYGTLVMNGSLIKDISTGRSEVATAIDCENDLVIAGLIDIHTDNLEKHFMPRSGAQWDSVGAAIAHDGQMATAGVTTVYDSLSLHGRKNGLDRGEALPMMIGGVDKAGELGALRVDHMLHLRCEVTNSELQNLIEPHLDNPRLKMLSVMDHTPGQRQSGSLETWKEKQYAKGKTVEEIDKFLKDAMSWRDLEGADGRRKMVAELGQERNIPVASHDDDTAENIQLAFDLGCHIAEFPVSLEAAQAAKKLNMVNVMGSPNFVRGRSHGDNASARDVAMNGQLDALCSDYVPLSMIRAAFMLTEAPFEWSLEKAIGTVTEQPALMSGLSDRGTLEVGKRADMVRVNHEPGRWPVIQGVWTKGRRAA